MRVLVTGAFGFVGRGVIRQLLDGEHQVVALQSPWSTTELRPAPDLTVARADLRDKRALAEVLPGVDAVCHLGARTRVRESFADPVGYYDTNLGGTIALLDAIRAANLSGEPTRVVFGSTAAVYGVADSYPVTERAPLRPTNPYSVSKAAAEALIRFTAEAGDIGATILRFANAAGAVDGFADSDVSRIIPKAVAVAAGRFPHVDVNGDGSARREYVHVLDIADACVQALTGPPDDADVINVGSGFAASIAEVIATARDVTGQAIPTINHPSSPEPPLVFSDNTVALTRLDWKPTRSDLERMISDAWAAEQPG